MEQVDRIGRTIPHARILKIARCGHSPHRDSAEEVLEAIRGFVRGVLMTDRPGHEPLIC